MDTLRVLVTGSSGLLGSEFLRGFESEKVYPADLPEVDVTNASDVNFLVKQTRPHVIIHAAAHTDVDKAEDEPGECFRVNVEGTRNVVRAAQSIGAKLVFISSTGIYGNHLSRPYREDDEVAPPTVHHKSKWEAERLVGNHCPEALIVRVGWLFGGPPTLRRNFVYKRYEEMTSKDRIVADPFQRGNPTWARDVVSQIRVLLAQNVTGTFNCVNHGVVSRLEYVREIAKAFGLTTEVVAAERPFTRKAPVSANESAENYRLGVLGLDRMPDYTDSLRAYVAELRQQLLQRISS